MRKCAWSVCGRGPTSPVARARPGGGAGLVRYALGAALARWRLQVFSFEALGSRAAHDLAVECLHRCRRHGHEGHGPGDHDSEHDQAHSLPIHQTLLSEPLLQVGRMARAHPSRRSPGEPPRIIVRYREKGRAGARTGPAPLKRVMGSLGRRALRTVGPGTGTVGEGTIAIAAADRSRVGTAAGAPCHEFVQLGKAHALARRLAASQFAAFPLRGLRRPERADCLGGTRYRGVLTSPIWTEKDIGRRRG